MDFKPFIYSYFSFFTTRFYIYYPQHFYIYLRQFIIDFIDFNHEFDEI